MPILRQEVILNIAGNLKALMRLEAGITRGPLAASGQGPAAGRELRGARARMRQHSRQIERLRRRLSRAKGRGPSEREDEHARKQRGQLGKENPGGKDPKARSPAVSKGTEEAIRPEDIVWIFGTGRSGTTWLASMMGEIRDTKVWPEPLVGALFGDFYFDRRGDNRGTAFILSPHHRHVWLSTIRSMVLDGAVSRYPRGSRTLVIKEPHGSTGAPMLGEALPESRLTVLVRDPRDVVASAMDARRPGGWTRERVGRRGGESLPRWGLDVFVERRAKLYLRDVGSAREAYEAHQGPKALIKYEDLRADALATLKLLYSALGIPVDEAELARAVEKHSWENIPQEEKGEGKFYRKASPGSWREDLTPEQVQIVESITAPVLEEFYGKVP
jgi:hypothetical protein